MFSTESNKKKIKKEEEEKSRYEFYPNKLGKAVY